jgi:hypothetical protein
MSSYPQSREEPGAREGLAKPGMLSRLWCWWWGGAEVEMGEEEPTWRITVYPPGPGAKLAELAGYFRERWKEFVFGVAAVLVATLLLTLVGLS